LSNVIFEASHKQNNYNDKILRSNNKIKTTWEIVKVESGKRINKDDNISRQEINVDGDATDNPQIIVNVFNEYFLSVAEKTLPQDNTTTTTTTTTTNATDEDYDDNNNNNDDINRIKDKYCTALAVLVRDYRLSHLVIHTFIPNYTSHHYSQYITLGSDPLMSCVRSGLEMSSLLEA
jgi:5'-3' exonuclease